MARINMFKFINTANRDKEISHSEFRVLLNLISYNSLGKIFPSLQQISNDTGIKSIPDISMKLHKLQDLGYIIIKRRKYGSNIYTLNIDDDNVKGNSNDKNNTILNLNNHSERENQIIKSIQTSGDPNG